MAQVVTLRKGGGGAGPDRGSIYRERRMFNDLDDGLLWLCRSRSSIHPVNNWCW